MGPPDYAPGIAPFRSMYDVIEMTSMDAGMIPRKNDTSYTRDILPLLLRLSNLQWVNAGFSEVFGRNGTYPISKALIEELVKPQNSAMRFELLTKFRSPEATGYEEGVNMLWPQLYGDSFDIPLTSSKELLAISQQTYKHLANFALGNYSYQAGDNPYLTGVMFPSIYPGTPLDELPIHEQPDVLDNASLYYCCADAFHPGCELTWPMRHATLYDEFLRIKRRQPGVQEADYGDSLNFFTVKVANGPLYAQGPGDLTRWMAIPWQGDTARCRSGYDQEYHPYLPSFWPAKVPNQVLTYSDYRQFMNTGLNQDTRDKTFENREGWQRLFFATGKENEKIIQQTVQHFDKLGIVGRCSAPNDYSSIFDDVFVENLQSDAPVPVSDSKKDYP